MNPCKRRFGFTIIELLVVIGIIAVLLAALIPMVGGSRDSAFTHSARTTCTPLRRA